jgi:hypothetical protein
VERKQEQRVFFALDFLCVYRMPLSRSAKASRGPEFIGSKTGRPQVGAAEKPVKRRNGISPAMLASPCNGAKPPKAPNSS